MRKRNIQSEKLFTNEELTELVSKIDSLELGEKIASKLGLKKIFNNSKFERSEKYKKK
jgi:hypothetical protein